VLQDGRQLNPLTRFDPLILCRSQMILPDAQETAPNNICTRAATLSVGMQPGGDGAKRGTAAGRIALMRFRIVALVALATIRGLSCVSVYAICAAAVEANTAAALKDFCSILRVKVVGNYSP